jgi:hypothetical protein
LKDTSIVSQSAVAVYIDRLTAELKGSIAEDLHGRARGQ